MTDATSIVLASRPKGTPSQDNFRQETHALPAPGDGEVLVRVIWLSLDPYMRGRMDDAKSYAAPVELDAVMEGGVVGEVLESRAEGLAVGDIVTGSLGWTTHAVARADAVRKIDDPVAPLSTYLGVLGMPGLTAWVGLNKVIEMQQGETVLISAATGAVGGLAGQLAKAKGLRAVGVAGDADKCAFATDTLGYDACLDHRATDAATLRDQIGKAAPDGIDGYFENVGGKTLEAVLPNMAMNGRIAVCGMIAWYNGKGIDEAMPLPAVWRTILTQRLRVQGFLAPDHFHRFPEFIGEVGPLVRDGRIAVREDVAEGLDSAPGKFLEMLEGGNFGKTLVRVGDDP
ncbi:NADP-dependent oxidoreductase [Tranquillimonas rosea]|uniref:NADP-dependent oxidoreductase n=1 Tax=Tranquillimonas rosea TaxID=641238 RepID=UPI003BAC6CB8